MRHEKVNGVVVFCPKGDFTREHHTDLPELNDILDDSLGQGESRFVLDMKNVTHIDSSGLGVIFALYKRISEAKGKFVIAEVSMRLMRLFDVMDVSSFAEIYESVEEAVKAIRKS